MGADVSYSAIILSFCINDFVVRDGVAIGPNDMPISNRPYSLNAELCCGAPANISIPWEIISVVGGAILESGIPDKIDAELNNRQYGTF